MLVVLRRPMVFSVYIFYILVNPTTTLLVARSLECVVTILSFAQSHVGIYCWFDNYHLNSS